MRSAQLPIPPTKEGSTVQAVTGNCLDTLAIVWQNAEKEAACSSFFFLDSQ